MQTQSGADSRAIATYTQPQVSMNDTRELLTSFSDKGIDGFLESGKEMKSNSQQNHSLNLDLLLEKLAVSNGKRSFLVFKHNKYVTIPTETIAFFYIKYDSPVIVCFDRQEYFINYSLEQLQTLLSGKQYFRLNRQYLINFNAIKEVEHYFARKLLVNLTIPTQEKLLVSKEKASSFLHWLENR